MIRTYQERRDRFAGARELENTKGLRLGWARLVVFVAGFSLYVAWDLSSGVVARGFGVGAGIAVVAFIILVLVHRKVRERQRWNGAMARINQEAIARLERNWEALPPSQMPVAQREHPYALDLDICGEASLFRLLCTVTLPPGLETLRNWLLEPAPPSEVLMRQEAVAELAPQVDLRQTLEAEGRLMTSPSPESLQQFLSWAEEGPWLPSHRWVVVGAWLLPLSTAVLGVLFLRGALPGPWWLLSLLGALALGYVNSHSIHPLLDRASAGEERFGRYAALLARLAEMEVHAPALQELREAVLSSSLSAEGELRRLGRRVAWGNVRFSSMAHAPLQAFLVWDVHVLASLERWKAQAGPHVRDWLDALGTLEALSALAALRADHPDWCLPELESKADGTEPTPRVMGRDLGHPLLPPDSCVRNDVEMGPPGSFLFVTGSNMSGKSTLLRAVGVNAVLAQAGGPVCAGEMEMTPLEVQTSMRTADSLAQGISQYMAELNRIRQVVERAREDGGPADETPPGSSARVLYLLDEPLQGTNEAERRVAVQTILGHLLDAGAIGAVATHDLHLDETGKLSQAARAVHLEGTVREGDKGPLLKFDYRVQPGRATSTNALALLRAVGLGEDERKEG